MFYHVTMPKRDHGMGIVGACDGRWCRATLTVVKLSVDHPLPFEPINYLLKKAHKATRANNQAHASAVRLLHLTNLFGPEQFDSLKQRTLIQQE